MAVFGFGGPGCGTGGVVCVVALAAGPERGAGLDVDGTDEAFVAGRRQHLSH